MWGLDYTSARELSLGPDVDLDRGAGYGNTLTWAEKDKPKIAAQPVEIQVDLDAEKFYRMFVSLMSAPTPGAH